MNLLTKIYYNLIGVGVTDSTLPSDRVKVELINFYVISAIPMLIIYLIYQFFQPYRDVDLFITIFWMLMVLIPIFFNYKNQYLTARILAILLPLLMFNIVFVVGGAKMSLEHSYLMMIIASVIFYEDRLLLIMLGFIIISYITVLILHTYIEPSIKEVNYLAKYAYVTNSFMITIFLAIKVKLLNRKYSHIAASQKLVLQNKNDELERFAYVAAHDLKTPLRNISSYLGLIEMRIKGSDNKLLSYLKTSQDSVKQLHHLVGDILEYSKINATENRNEKIDLNQIIESIKQSISLVIKENNVKILSEPLPKMSGDKLQIKLLFQNLIDNAIKYNESQEPTIEIRCERTKSNQVTIKIIDNGIGIDSKYIDQIFTMFKRLHSSEKYKGSGLGLAIAKKIVENHQGSIYAESVKGKGTTFSITLPVS